MFLFAISGIHGGKAWKSTTQVVCSFQSTSLLRFYLQQSFKKSVLTNMSIQMEAMHVSWELLFWQNSWFELFDSKPFQVELEVFLMSEPDDGEYTEWLKSRFCPQYCSCSICTELTDIKIPQKIFRFKGFVIVSSGENTEIPPKMNLSKHTLQTPATGNTMPYESIHQVELKINQMQQILSLELLDLCYQWIYPWFDFDPYYSILKPLQVCFFQLHFPKQFPPFWERKFSNINRTS